MQNRRRMKKAKIKMNIMKLPLMMKKLITSLKILSPFLKQTLNNLYVKSFILITIKNF